MGHPGRPKTSGRVFRLRTHERKRNDTGYTSYALGVPSDVARRMIENEYTQFRLEIVEAGLLYMPIKGEQLEVEPEWLRSKDSTDP